MTVKVKIYNTLIIALLICFGLPSCKKFLDAKSNDSLATPEALSELQAMLDNFTVMSFRDGSAGEIASDNYFLIKAEFDPRVPEYKARHTWKPGNLFLWGNVINDWDYCYSTIYVANTVLDRLAFIPRGGINSQQWNNIKAQALVYRARAFQTAAYTWAVAYDSSTAATDLGIPLRLDPNFNETSVRSSVQETYDQIIADLKEAIPLFSGNQPNLLRPTKLAAYGLLSRTYLSMRKYREAYRWADSVLLIKSDLLDYNTAGINRTQSSSPAFVSIAFNTPQINPEIIMVTATSIPDIINVNRGIVDTILYASYHDSDWRKFVYFRLLPNPLPSGKPALTFKGNYTGMTAPFTGLATDEMYLTRAECFARDSNKTAALADLNALLRKRFRTGRYQDTTTANAGQALDLILIERRKELIMRNLRWMDIKRLNKEGAGIELRRYQDGIQYKLPPNDPRYAMALPEDVLSLTGMPQNPR
jgi:hypothetical protein